MVAVANYYNENNKINSFLLYSYRMAQKFNGNKISWFGKIVKLMEALDFKVPCCRLKLSHRILAYFNTSYLMLHHFHLYVCLFSYSSFFESAVVVYFHNLVAGSHYTGVVNTFLMHACISCHKFPTRQRRNALFEELLTSLRANWEINPYCTSAWIHALADTMFGRLKITVKP